MILGVVSNCWRTQLDSGEQLEALVDQAAHAGYGVIELRQGCLGRYEDAVGTPDAEALAGLPQRFPHLKFNLAIQFPFFDPQRGTADAPLFRAAIDAAGALAGHQRLHLRLVDLVTRDAGPEDIDDVAQSVAKLVEPLGLRNATLSLENAGQSWDILCAVRRRAAELLNRDAPALRLCYDPCNLLAAADRPDPRKATQSLKPAELSMVHFKQQQSGTLLPTVCDGELDWSGQLAELQEIGYDGPALFEVAPHERIWDNLEESRQYLNRLSDGWFA